MTASRDTNERQKAEEAEAQSIALLRATLESTADGILTVGADGQILSSNKTFVKMWRITADMLASNNDRLLLQFVLDQLHTPEHFLAKVRHLYECPMEESFDTLEFKDGRVFERYSRPMVVEGRSRGRVWSFRDITERRRAEQEQRLLAAIVEFSDDAIIGESLDGKITSWNRGAERVFGYAAAEAIGRPVLMLFPPEGAHEEEAIRARIARGEIMDHFETVRVRKDGRRINVSTTISPLKNGHGKVIGASKIARDITGQKQAEAALKLSDFSVAHASLPTFWITPDARIVRVNHAVCALLGYTEAELLQLAIPDLDPDFRAESWRRRWQELRERKQICVETRHRRKDGRIVPIEVEANWFEFDGQEYNFAFVRDITERQRAATVANDQRRILEMIASDAPLNDSLSALLHMIETQADDVLCSILLVDSDHKHLRYAAALRLPEAYIQAVPRIPIGPSVGSCGTAAFRRKPVFVADIASDPLWEEAKAVAQPHGLRACWSTPILDSQQRVLGTFAIYRRQTGLPSPEQITLIDLAVHTAAIAVGRHQAKATLQETESQLRQMQKMEGIGQLAGGVAHDFNNILSVMLMQIELIGTVENLPGAAREGLNQIKADAKRAAELTRQLLLFSRRQVMQVRLLELNEVVMNLGKMLHRIIGEDVRLQLHLHAVPLMIRADMSMLDQVLVNLAVNARDAMPGGGQLLIETGEATLDGDIRHLNLGAEPGRYAWFSVGDTGKGIPPEVLPQIFEPFFTTKEVGKGTGMGLATVFGIVKQHRGLIKVDNRPGEGATFKVFLPLSAMAATETAKREESPRPRGGKETILLVEDEPDLRKLTGGLLRRNGYTVVEATDGVEALEVWQAHRAAVALLLTDLVMPGGLNGHELARKLVAQAPGLKVVFASGYSANIAGQEFQPRDGDAFIQKPFTTRHLLETIRRSLDA